MKSMYHKLKDGEISRKEYRDFIGRNNGCKDFNEYKRNWRHKTGRQLSMSENKKCSAYLGVYIAERFLSKIWDNVIRMPYGNPDFDFICNKGFKVQVKSACITDSKVISRYGYEYHYDVFGFPIDRNKITDYFLLLAFDNRDDLNPIHIWLIKGDEIINRGKLNDKISLSILDNVKSINKYKKYEQTDKLEKLKECCNMIKSNPIK